MVLFAVIIFFTSPAPRYLISLLPAEFFFFVFSSFYETVEFIDEETFIDKNRIFRHHRVLPVLGRDTALCFTLNQADQIEPDILQDLKQGKRLARVFAMNKDNQAYPMDAVTVDYPRDREDLVVICQKFDTNVSIIPRDLTKIAVEPKFAFPVISAQWVTAKDLP